jgi:hypothetical protein
LTERACFSDIGRVLSIDPKNLPQAQEALSSQEIEDSNPPLVQTQIASNSGPHLLERSWNLETPAGPTAYILDPNQIELGFNLDRISQLLEIGPNFLGIRVGITRYLMLEANFGIYLSQGGARINFKNDGHTAYSARLWAGIPYSGSDGNNSTSYYSYNEKKKHSALGLEFVRSHLFDEEHRLHLSIEGARNFIKGSSTSYIYSNSPDSNTSTYSIYDSNSNRDIYIARLTGAYEVRFDQKHGITLWVSPELAWDNYQSSNFTTFSSGNSRSDTSRKSILIGAGYHYWQEHFGLSIGLSVGVGFENNEYDYSYSGSSVSSNQFSYSNTPAQGAITGGINYRL